MSDFSAELARWMQAQGTGVRELHRISGYSAAYISQLRHGKRNPSADVARDLDDALGAGGALKAAMPVAGKGLSRAQGLQGGEDVTDVLDRLQQLDRSRLDPEIIEQVRDELRQAVAQYETLDHDRLVRHLLKQRAWAETALNDCGHPGQRQRLYEIAGTASGVLGYVAVGRGDFALARAYCLESFRLADYAEDASLQAWVRGTHSFCEYYAGRYGDALTLAEDGLKYAASGPQSVRLIANGVARARGKLGDAQGVHRAVGEADDLLSQNSAPHGIASSITLGCYSRAQAASNAATAYVSLGMPKKVRHYIGLAMPDVTSCASPWGQSLVKIDLAFS
jgi:transcriptional regulator with XRE-family HTH domain